MFLPKDIGSYFRSRDVVLKGFHPPSHAGEAEAHPLCPVCALEMYVQCSVAFRSTQLLFVCCSDLPGAALSLSSGCLTGCVRLFA